MAKTLRIGASTIRLWFGPPQFRAWFALEAIHDLKDAGGTVLQKGILTVIRESRPRGSELYDDERAGESDAHAEQLVDVLAAEFAALISHGDRRGGERLKSYATYSLGISHRRDEPFAPNDEAGLYTDEDSWKAPPSPIKELCKMVFRHGSNEVADSHKALWADVKRWSRSEIERDTTDERIFYLVQELGEWAFLFLRRAKLQQLLKSHPFRDPAGKTTSEPTLRLDSTAKNIWQTVCVLSSVALDWSRLLHPALDSFEEKERVKALCLYAVGAIACRPTSLPALVGTPVLLKLRCLLEHPVTPEAVLYRPHSRRIQSHPLHQIADLFAK